MQSSIVERKSGSDPQEQRQEVLIKRIANSVDRLSVALADLTKQMEVGMIRASLMFSKSISILRI